MLCVCVRGVINVVFSVCIVMRGAVGDRVWKYECFVIQMLYVVSCAVAVSAFIICSGLCACTEML